MRAPIFSRQPKYKPFISYPTIHIEVYTDAFTLDISQEFRSENGWNTIRLWSFHILIKIYSLNNTRIRIRNHFSWDMNTNLFLIGRDKLTSSTQRKGITSLTTTSILRKTVELL